MAEMIRGYANRGQALTRRDMTTIVGDMITQRANPSSCSEGPKLPSMKWVKMFEMRHELVVRHGRKLQKQRAVLPKWKILRFFTLMRSWDISSTPPSLIINMDETGVVLRQDKCVICDRNDLKAFFQEDRVPLAVTCVAPVVASGSSCKPMILLPGKVASSLPDHTMQCFFFITGHTTKGWMTKALFTEWVKSILLPYVLVTRASLQTPYAPACLILDSHSSRRNSEALEMMRSNGITAFTIPAHSSHLMQPLDLTAYGTLKCILKRQRIFLDPMRHLESLEKALSQAACPSSVREGFRLSGIFPLNE